MNCVTSWTDSNDQLFTVVRQHHQNSPRLNCFSFRQQEGITYFGDDVTCSDFNVTNMVLPTGYHLQRHESCSRRSTTSTLIDNNNIRPPPPLDGATHLPPRDVNTARHKFHTETDDVDSYDDDVDDDDVFSGGRGLGPTAVIPVAMATTVGNRGTTKNHVSRDSVTSPSRLPNRKWQSQKTAATWPPPSPQSQSGAPLRPSVNHLMLLLVGCAVVV
jgi:hypothetical protein